MNKAKTVYANLSVGDKAQAQLAALSRLWDKSKAEVVRMLLDNAIAQLTPREEQLLDELEARQ